MEDREAEKIASSSFQTKALTTTLEPNSTPHSYKTISHQKNLRALSSLLLDRDSLSTLGIPSNLINRMYRALYVYSMGFHDLISEIHQHSGNYVIYIFPSLTSPNHRKTNTLSSQATRTPSPM